MVAWDLVIVGGGPAGMSAALVAAGNGLKTLLLERSAQLGGAVRLADHPLTEVLGLPSERGAQLADHFADQISKQRIEFRSGFGVDAVARRGLDWEVVGAQRFEARAVLLATGTRMRRLGLAKEEQFGLYQRARENVAAWARQKVVVVGGGDEAVETARWLAEAGAAVVLVARGELRARPQLRKKMQATSGIEVILDEVAELQGDTKIEAVRLKTGRILAADGCFARIGVEVELPRLPPEVALDPDGRPLVDPWGRTSAAGLYAAGDLVTDGPRHYIAVAMGLGTAAARDIERLLSE